VRRSLPFSPPLLLSPDLVRSGGRLHPRHVATVKLSRWSPSVSIKLSMWRPSFLGGIWEAVAPRPWRLLGLGATPATVLLGVPCDATGVAAPLLDTIRKGRISVRWLRCCCLCTPLARAAASIVCGQLFECTRGHIQWQQPWCALSKGLGLWAGG
jgi:hypothetical protein